jgi:hypothetical protein
MTQSHATPPMPEVFLAGHVHIVFARARSQNRAAFLDSESRSYPTRHLAAHPGPRAGEDVAL